MIAYKDIIDKLLCQHHHHRHNGTKYIQMYCEYKKIFNDSLFFVYFAGVWCFDSEHEHREHSVGPADPYIERLQCTQCF